MAIPGYGGVDETTITGKNGKPALKIRREGDDYLITDPGTERIRAIRTDPRDARRAAAGIRTLDSQIQRHPIFCLSHKNLIAMLPTKEQNHPIGLFINPVWTEEEIERAAKRGPRAAAEILAARPCPFQTQPKPNHAVRQAERDTPLLELITPGSRPCDRHHGLCTGKLPPRPSLIRRILALTGP